MCLPPNNEPREIQVDSDVTSSVTFEDTNDQAVDLGAVTVEMVIYDNNEVEVHRQALFPRTGEVGAYDINIPANTLTAGAHHYQFHIIDANGGRKVSHK